MLKPGLRHKSLPSIIALPVTAATTEQRAEPQLFRSSLRCPQHYSSINCVNGSGAVQAPEENLQDSMPGQPCCSPCPRWCTPRNKCTPLLSSAVCFKTKCQWAFQIKTLKMYEQQLSHTRELITLVEFFFSKTDIFNISVFACSSSFVKLKARRAH